MRTDFKRYVIVAFATLLGHGLLIETSNQYLYDAGPCSYYWRHHQQHFLFSWWIDAGLPVQAAVLYFLSLFHPLTEPVHACLALLLISFSGFIFWKILEKCEAPSDVATVVVLSYVTYPFTTFWSSPSFLPNLFIQFLFFTSTFIFLKDFDCPSQRRWRIISYALAFLTFSIRSFLIVIPVTFCLLTLQRRRTVASLINRVDIVATSIVGGLAYTSLFPTRGIYKDYNHVFWSVRNAIGGYVATFQAIPDSFPKPMAIAFSLVLFIGLILFVQKVRKTPKDKERELIVASFFLLLVSVLPYALVSKPPMSSGYGVRHFFVPAPFLILFLVSFLHSTYPKHFFRAISTLVVILLIIMSVARYGEWKLRKAQDLAFLSFAQRNADLKSFSSFFILRRPQLKRIGDVDIRFYEYTPLLNEAWSGLERWAVFDVTNDRTKVSELKKLATSYDTNDPGSFQLRNYIPSGLNYELFVDFLGKRDMKSLLFNSVGTLAKDFSIHGAAVR